MAILEIRTYGDPVLWKKALPVDLKDPLLPQLVADMAETMVVANGVGLAANQVGILKRVVVINITGGEDPQATVVLLNPEVIETAGEVEEEEGCLSVPENAEGEGILRAKIKRAAFCRVRAQRLDGQWFEIAGDGIMGKALQHETDHLNGTLFVDKLSMGRQVLLGGRLKAIKAATLKVLPKVMA
jgi:peptide deformylase